MRIRSARAIRAGATFVRVTAWSVALTIGLLSLPVIAQANEVQSGAAAAAATDYLPDAALVDQAGRPVSLAALKGKPVLVGFIHTSCGGVCELMTAKMKSVAQALDPSFSTKVTMVSVTTDPKEDGPAQLTAYAKAQGAVGQGWVFLTGPSAQIARVLKTYKVPQGDPGDETTHVLELYLIGPDGHELRQYNGTEIKAATVAADIRDAISRR